VDGWLTYIRRGTLLSLLSSSRTLDRDLPFRSTPFTPLDPGNPFRMGGPWEVGSPLVVVGRAVRSLELELLEFDRERPFGFGEGEVAISVEEERMPEYAGEEGLERGLVWRARR